MVFYILFFSFRNGKLIFQAFDDEILEYVEKLLGTKELSNSLIELSKIIKVDKKLSVSFKVATKSAKFMYTNNTFFFQVIDEDALMKKYLKVSSFYL